LIILSTAGLSAYSISGMIALRGANTLNTLLTVGAVMWISVLLYGVSFNEGYPYNLFGFFLFASIFALFIVIYEAIKYFKKRSFEKGLF